MHPSPGNRLTPSLPRDPLRRRERQVVARQPVRPAVRDQRPLRIGRGPTVQDRPNRVRADPPRGRSLIARRGRDGDTASGRRRAGHQPDRPSSGKFAVKVVNHYGDEVLQVYDVR